MDQESLNARCVELIFNNPRVKAQMWFPRLFWHGIDTKDDPVPEDLGPPRVDLCELEVLLSAAAGEPSQCAAELNARQPSRADFILRQVRRGERPWLSLPR